jgi:hypothetical protein
MTQPTRVQTSLFDLEEYQTLQGADYQWDTIGRDPYWDEICDQADRDRLPKTSRRGTQAGNASGWITYEDKISKNGNSTRYYAYRWFLSTGRVGYRGIRRSDVGLVRSMIDRGDRVAQILESMPVRRRVSLVKP